MNENNLTQSPSEAVKEQTSDLHELVEATLGQRFFRQDSLGRDDFIELLRSFYRIYSPLEERLVPMLQSTLAGFDYEPRADRIRQDLNQLGVNNEKIDRWELLPTAELVHLQGKPELLGCLYVVEGSEMGNHVMRSQLDDLLPEDCPTADHFFRYRGDEIRSHWGDFQQRLNDEITAREELDRMIVGARETFSLFRRGFEWPNNS